MTEYTVAAYLEQLRRNEGCLGLSFDTIAAYNENAAMMHYSASEESAAMLKAEGMLLVDSGGHYYEGSTDVTRNFILGPVPEEWKKHYTVVVKCMLQLADAVFLHGCSGKNLDILSRGPLWSMGLDYRCGTGHGVGYLLSVHEPPNGFHWKIIKDNIDHECLEEGMVTTDEPGVYVEGSHGIRIENELLCKKDIKNEYGQFMKFETLTYVPIDLDGIAVEYLNDADIERLNRYHKLVYEVLSPGFTEEEKQWLQKYTRAIEKKMCENV